MSNIPNQCLLIEELEAAVLAFAGCLLLVVRCQLLVELGCGKTTNNPQVGHTRDEPWVHEPVSFQGLLLLQALPAAAEVARASEPQLFHLILFRSKGVNKCNGI